MAFANVDDSMGVAVEVPIVGANAEEEDIFNIENDIDYPFHAEVNVARTRMPWFVDTLDAQFACPSRAMSPLPPMEPLFHTTSLPLKRLLLRGSTLARPLP